jgi:hypothetical protein
MWTHKDAFRVLIDTGPDGHRGVLVHETSTNVAPRAETRETSRPCP